MRPSRIFSIITALSTGTGASSLWMSHELTKETIWKQIYEDAILTGNGAGVDPSAWIALRNKLDGLETIKSPGLQEIKDSKTTDPKAEKLKRWCADAYKWIYKSAIKMGNSELLEEVKTACIRKIGDQLEKGKINFEELNGHHDDLLKKKLEELKTHDSVEKSKKVKLDRVLKDLKSRVEKNSKNVQRQKNDLKNWCKQAYERGYKGSRNNMWQLVNLYCIKSNENGHSS